MDWVQVMTGVSMGRRFKRPGGVRMSRLPFEESDRKFRD